LGEDMTLHDAALEHFSQWWKRSLRSGYAYAQGVSLHGAPPERLGVVESRRAWLWGLWIPAVAAALAAAGAWWWALCAVLLYPLQVLRLAMRGGRSSRENWSRAVALVLSKFPEMLGQARFLLYRWRDTPSRLIEYK
jgi:hypothetical protein